MLVTGGTAGNVTQRPLASGDDDLFFRSCGVRNYRLKQVEQTSSPTLSPTLRQVFRCFIYAQEMRYIFLFCFCVFICKHISECGVYVCVCLCVCVCVCVHEHVCVYDCENSSVIEA